MLVLTSQDGDSYIVFSKRRPLTDPVVFDVIENSSVRPTHVRPDTMGQEQVETALFTLAGRGWVAKHHPDPSQKARHGPQRPHQASSA